jgi:hypothetical protein
MLAPVIIDRFLPGYEWNEVHSVEIAAPPAAVLDALRRVTADEIPLLGVLFAMRRLPGRLLGRPARTAAGEAARGDRGPLLEDILRSGFVLLEEGGREVVVGIVGRFWQARPDNAEVGGAAAFLSFVEPGWAKAAMNFSVAESGGGTRLTTETRIVATDARARRRFGAYWLVVRPGSGLIRRMWLRAVKKRAESS